MIQSVGGYAVVCLTGFTGLGGVLYGGGDAVFVGAGVVYTPSLPVVHDALLTHSTLLL